MYCIIFYNTILILNYHIVLCDNLVLHNIFLHHVISLEISQINYKS